MKAFAGAVGALALVASGLTAPSHATGEHPQAAWSRARSAKAFALDVLDQAPLPPGASPWKGTVPPAARRLFAHPGSNAPMTERVYLVHEAATAPLLNYVLAHLPAGSTTAGTGWTADRQEQTSEEFSATLPTFGPHEYSAVLSYVTTTQAGRGCLNPKQTCLLQVGAQTLWEPARSAAEIAPVDDLATLTLSPSSPAVVVGPTQPRPATFKLSPSASAKVVKAFDALPLAPPVVCMEDLPLYTLVLRPPAGKTGNVFKVVGWQCASEVSVAIGATALHLLHDPERSLDKVLCQVAPKAASAESGNCPLPAVTPSTGG
ncbi:MAG: hypothetical protein ACP5VR_05710 [Acidimicrobiales bacterium]